MTKAKDLLRVYLFAGCELDGTKHALTADLVIGPQSFPRIPERNLFQIRSHFSRLPRTSDRPDERPMLGQWSGSMSSSQLFDLPLGLDARARLSELALEGCVLSSRTYRETVQVRDPCENPESCWGDCDACLADPYSIECQRTHVIAFRDGSVVWDTWV